MGLVVAYTSAAPAPSGAQVDAYVDLAVTPFPIAPINLYGDGTEVGDPGPVLTFAWTILEKPAGSAVRFQDTGNDNSTLQNPVLLDVDTWENVVVFLVVTNTNTGNSSEADYYAAPTTARVHVRVQSANTGLEKLAYLELNWRDKYHDLVAAVDGFVAGAGVIPPPYPNLIGGGYAYDGPTLLHKHMGEDVDVARTTTRGTALLSDAPVDPNNPVALNRDCVVLSAQVAGFRDATGIHPWQVGENLDAAGNPAPLVVFEVPDDDMDLEEFYIHMQDGGSHTDYTFEIWRGSAADWVGGTMAAIAGFTVTDGPASPNGPLVLEKPAGVHLETLSAGTYIGVMCTQAPVAAWGGGMTVTIPLRRKV